MKNEYGFRKDYDPKKRIVAQHYFYLNDDKYFISTIDLGIDHSFLEEYPVYYETMIFEMTKNFGEPIFMKRYETREEALNNHNIILENIEYLYNFNKIEKVLKEDEKEN